MEKMTDSEKKEFEEYDKLLALQEAQSRFIEDFTELEDIVNFPPLNLRVHYYSFKDEMTAAYNRIPTYKKYDTNLVGKIKKKFKNQIDEALKAKEKYESPAAATDAYISNKNNGVTIHDFANKYMLG
jgi:hypothetical protein